MTYDESTAWQPPPPNYPMSPTYQPPKRGLSARLKLAIVIGVLVVVGAVVATVLLATGSSGSFTTVGSISLTTGPDGETGTSNTCAGRGGYSDLAVGTQVIVSDAAGKTLAIGQITSGAQVPASFTCAFVFTVSNVPGGHSFYGVSVSHRGVVQYTESQLRNGVTLSIG